VALVKEGWLHTDVGWSPAEESALAVHMLALVIDGQDVEFPLPCHAPLTSLTKENVDEAAPWTATREQADEWVHDSNCEVTEGS
jgi:ABC-type sugar transport system substrate-binding protein